jgi:hypothetical protein
MRQMRVITMTRPTASAFGQDLTQQDQPMLAGDKDNLFIFSQQVFKIAHFGFSHINKIRRFFPGHQEKTAN